MKNTQELKAKNIAKRKIQEEKKFVRQANKQNKNLEKEKINIAFANKYSSYKKSKINSDINKIKQIYGVKVKELKLKVKNTNWSPIESKEKEKLKSSLLVKYYKFRIENIKKIFSKKIKKVEHKFNIGLLSLEESKSKIEKLRIDEGSFYKRWDVALVKKENLTSKMKIINQIKRLEQKRDKQINSLKKRLTITSPTNSFGAFKDKWENLKSKYVFGIEVRDLFTKTSNHIKKYSMFYVLASILVFFAIATRGVSLSSANFVDNIIMNNTYIYIIGLGMLLVILGGYIDLSVGTMMGFLGAISVILFNLTDNILITLLLTVIFGVGIGFINGILIGYCKMPAFIVTLAGMLLFSGLTLIVTNSKALTPISDVFGNSQYIEFVTGAMPDIKAGNFFIFSFLIVFSLGVFAVVLMLIGRTKKARYSLITDSNIGFAMKILFIIGMFLTVAYFAGTSTFGLRYYLLYIMILVAIFIFITQNTSFGRKVYAIGGNKAAAELSGISVGRTTTYIFMIVGAMVGFASIVFTGVLTSASPQVASAGYELDVISSVFVGGASMSGGIGTVAGTFIGGLVLASIRNGFDLMSIATPMQSVIKAIVLLGAVGYDIYSNRKIG